MTESDDIPLEPHRNDWGRGRPIVGAVERQRLIAIGVIRREGTEADAAVSTPFHNYAKQAVLPIGGHEFSFAKRDALAMELEAERRERRDARFRPRRSIDE